MKKLVYLFIVAITVLSCNKDDGFVDEAIGSSLSETTSIISIVAIKPFPCSEYELLEFSSMRVFKNTIENMNQNKDIKAFDLGGFYSLYEHYTIAGVKDFDDILYDLNLAKLLSAEGEIKIGNKIYRVTNDFVLVYQNCEGKKSSLQFMAKDKTILQLDQQGHIIESNDQFQIFITKHQDDSDNEKRYTQSKCDEFEDNKFIVGKMWHSDWYFYSSIGVETYLLERKFNWNGSSSSLVPLFANAVTVAWDVHFKINHNQSIPIFNFTRCPNQCDLLCTSKISKADIKTVPNDWTSTEVLGWSIGLEPSLSGEHNPILSGPPEVATKLSYWRHRNDQNTLSSHSARLNGAFVDTDINFWWKCE